MSGFVVSADALEGLRLVADAMPDALLVLDERGVIVSANEATREVLGHAPDDLRGEDVVRLVPEELRRPHAAMLRRHLPRGLQCPARRMELTALHRDGRAIPVEVSITEIAGPGSRLHACLVRDLSHRKAIERRLRASEERHALAMRGANDGHWDWDIAAGTITFSPRWSAMLGLSAEEAVTDPEHWFSRVLPEDLPRLKEDIAAHLEGRTAHFQNEHRLYHADGTVRFVLSRGLAVRTADGPVRMAGSLTDVTEQRQAQERLRQEALIDPLTGLPNRAFFLDRLRQAMARARRRGREVCVLYIDLDGFKVVNDSLGHPAGDELLTAFSRRLLARLSPADSAARLGGDEFVVLVEGGLDAAIRIADALQEDLRTPFDVAGDVAWTSASIGIARHDASHERPEDIVRDADTALYRAKAAGKARHAVFEPTMHVRAISRLQVENDLRRALERDELHLEFQPIVRLATGDVERVEALIRWDHPAHRELAATEFLGIAEDGRLAEELGAWVIAHACERLARWRARHGAASPEACVNVSPRHLASASLARDIQDGLSRHGLPPGSLWLEVSEGALASDLAALARDLAPLREIGVRLALDHFGASRCPLSALHAVPFDAVKIDRSLVERVAGDRRMGDLVRGMAGLAAGMGMEVVAQGIDGPRALAAVGGMACELVQGNGIHGVLRAAEVDALLARGARSACGG